MEVGGVARIEAVDEWIPTEKGLAAGTEITLSNRSCQNPRHR